MEKPSTTIDDLAELMLRTMASTEDVKGLEERLTARLDRIEHLILKAYGQRIEQLEQQVKKRMEALAV